MPDIKLRLPLAVFVSNISIALPLAQGNCDDPAPEVARGEPITNLKPGVCVLNLGARFMEWFSIPSAPDVWFDKLYLRHSSNRDVWAIVEFSPLPKGAQLWLTNVTMDGFNGKAEGFLVRNSMTYVSGAQPFYTDNARS